jgi:hypothetical protein
MMKEGTDIKIDVFLSYRRGFSRCDPMYELSLCNCTPFIRSGYPLCGRSVGQPRRRKKKQNSWLKEHRSKGTATSLNRLSLMSTADLALNLGIHQCTLNLNRIARKGFTASRENTALVTTYVLREQVLM